MNHCAVNYSRGDTERLGECFSHSSTLCIDTKIDHRIIKAQLGKQRCVEG